MPPGRPFPGRPFPFPPATDLNQQFFAAMNAHSIQIRRTALRGLAAAALAGALAGAAGCGRAAPETVPGLMYHHLAPDPGGDVWTVGTDEFRRQVADLQAAGYRTILPGDLARRRPWKFWQPRKPVVITFDDGLRSTLTDAEPILHAAGFRAICYLITGNVADAPETRVKYRQDDSLIWPEVRDMLARGTFAFGIHSFSHTSDPARQALEVVECRAIFKRQTGQKTRAYCYPYGVAPGLLRDAVAAAGYRTAMICGDQTFTNAPGADFLRIPRVSVFGGTHRFSATPAGAPGPGAFCADVRNDGVGLAARGVLRDLGTGRRWSRPPVARLDGHAQTWCWTNLPAGPAAAGLQVEIWEQNSLFRYYP